MDPREQLIKTGAELLDAVYLCEIEKPTRTRLQKLPPGSDEAKEAIDKIGGLMAMLEMLTHLYDRDRLVKEYMMLRGTIEAMERPRTDDIVPGIVNPERKFPSSYSVKLDEDMDTGNYETGSL